jgi:hypothetical protein
VAVRQSARGSFRARLGERPGARNRQVTTSASICGRRSWIGALGLFHPSVKREVSVNLLNISSASITATRRFVHGMYRVVLTDATLRPICFVSLDRSAQEGVAIANGQ